MDFDEMWPFVGSKKQVWIQKLLTVVHGELWSGCLVIVMLQPSKTLDKVKHLTNCIFYTDDWDAFAKGLPKKRHIIGKKHTTLSNKITVIRVIIWGGLRVGLGGF
jgi:insertion element IS1 protein InsB